MQEFTRNGNTNIKISAERLAEKGVIALQETPYVDPQNKQTRPSPRHWALV
jgi:hypothetical protein